jgi:hypothetical protein
MAVVIVVGAATVEDEVAAGSPLDHGEVLELLSQPVDPEGETLHARVLVHIMMLLDVEGCPNTFKLSEGALPLHLSSPTSTLDAFNFNPRRLSISKPRPFSISSSSP